MKMTGKMYQNVLKMIGFDKTNRLLEVESGLKEMLEEVVELLSDGSGENTVEKEEGNIYVLFERAIFIDLNDDFFIDLINFIKENMIKQDKNFIYVEHTLKTSFKRVEVKGRKDVYKINISCMKEML